MVVAFVVLHVPLACSIYPWEKKMIEKIVSPGLFLLVTTCDIISTISLCARVFLMRLRLPYFCKVNSPETN